MHKMMLVPIGILVACSTVYAAGSTENSPTPAPTADPVSTPAPALTTAPAPAPAVAPAPTPKADPAPKAANVSLSGKWTSNLVDEITIEQTGNKIAGIYKYIDDDGITLDGKIEGLIKGKLIQAKWWERPKVGSGEESRGDLEWKMTEDGKTLAGWYREEGEEEKRDWNLQR